MTPKLSRLDGSPVILYDEVVYPITIANGGRTADLIADWHHTVETTLAGEPIGPAPQPETDSNRFGPPVVAPGKIVGAPVNYRDHQAEMKVEHTITGLGFFLKSPTSVVGQDGTVPIPFPDRRTDQEAELGVVIGRTASQVSHHQALDYVFGYTCLVDVTVRGSEERSTRKSFAGFTPIGPWITPADDVPDPNQLRLRGWVNDELRQDANTADMVYGVAELIEFISSVTPLEPGDIIATGTPAGVGPIQPGDQIRVEIERLGTLTIDVVAGSHPPHPLWLTQRDSV